MKKFIKQFAVISMAALLLGGCGKEKTPAFTYADCKDLQFNHKTGDAGQDPLMSDQTGLIIEEDGTFSACYSALRFEETGDDYPAGTMQYASVFGSLGVPEKLDDYTYRAGVESLSYGEEVGTEDIQSGLRMLYTEVRGLEDAEEFIIYLPGKKVADLPEAYIEDVKDRLYDENGNLPDTLTFYGIYNEKDEAGFYSIEAEEPK